MMPTYELEENMQLTITGPATVAVAPPGPKGSMPGYDPENDPQIALMRSLLEPMGYKLEIVASDEPPPVARRYPQKKVKREGPTDGGPAIS